MPLAIKVFYLAAIFDRFRGSGWVTKLKISLSETFNQSIHAHAQKIKHKATR